MSGHAPTPAASSGHTSRAKDPAIVQEAQKPISWIENIFLLIFALIAVSSIYSTYQEAVNKAKIEREQRALIDAAQVSTPIVSEKKGYEFRLYTFGADGCVTTDRLEDDAKFFPKRGEVEITSLASGHTWRDKPGVDNVQPTQPAGKFKVCRIDPNASGIEVGGTFAND